MTVTLDHRTTQATDSAAIDAFTRPGPVVDALCIIEDNADQMEAAVWPPVANALRIGITLDEIANTMHEDTEWIAQGLLSWADGQEMDGRMTEDEGDRLRELLHAAGGPAPIPKSDDSGDAWRAALQNGAALAGRLTDYAYPAGHPTWCQPSACSAWAERGGSITVFHSAILLDDGPVEVEVRCSESIPADSGPASRSAARLYVDGVDDGVCGDQAVRLAEAVTRASVLIGQDVSEVL